MTKIGAVKKARQIFRVRHKRMGDEIKEKKKWTAKEQSPGL